MFLDIFLYLLISYTLRPKETPIPQVYHSVTISSNEISPTPTLMPSPTTFPTQIPTPQITNPSVIAALPASDYESLFDQYSSQYGVDKELMKKIAKCESGYNPGSRNGTYGGMFQFAESTWVSTRSQMARDTNPDLRFSAGDAIETAAFKISHGGVGAWSGCL